MKIYRVGGCVRDRLLGLPVKDIDHVVTGATAEQMIALGYKPIGRDFPVFLHPQSKQEYALARSERKVAPGYRGFVVDADPATTIEQDLQRRDLTINAIAEDENGAIVDPWCGRRDLDRRLLRHVSPAFSEDPVRVLRVARFAARFHRLGFAIADETRALIRQMADAGELAALVPERVWVELARALDEPDPQLFFESLRDCGVLNRLFPEIDALFGVPQTAKYHPEIDTGVHLMMALKKAADLGFDNQTRFAVLMHDLGKATTPPELLPGHRGHEQRGKTLVQAFCERWRAPKAHTRLALLATEYHTHVHRALELRPATVLDLIGAADGQRNPERFRRFLDACLADQRGRTGFGEAPYPQADYLARVNRRLGEVDIAAMRRRGLDGAALGQEIRRARLELIAAEKASTLEQLRKAPVEQPEQRA